jgi:hypothetical protein
MRQGNDGHPLPLMANPLVGMYLEEHTDVSPELVEFREKQREHEVRLLGTMLFQAIFLSLCILLYSRWEWAQFNTPYEAMVFWFTASFALQAGFYFIFRAAFEDSSSHRRSLKRMRQSNRRQMSAIKMEQEKLQLQSILGQQMNSFHGNLQHAMSDGIMTSQEQTDISTQMSQLLQTIGQMQPEAPQTAAPAAPTAKQMGVDRHRIMGVPIGPRLTLEPSIQASNAPLAQSAAHFTNEGQMPSGTLNLTPSGTQEEREKKRADEIEQAAVGR